MYASVHPYTVQVTFYKAPEKHGHVCITGRPVYIEPGSELGESSVDIVSMVFVLSAIHPDKHLQVRDVAIFFLFFNFLMAVTLRP